MTISHRTQFARSLLVTAVFALLFAAPACGGNGGSSDDSGEDDNNSTPEMCGNDALDEGEVCDGSQLDGETCSSLGYGGGELECKSDCLDFDRSGCNAPETCGDGEVQDLETCDGSVPDGTTCESLGFESGSLACAENCLEFDTSGCNSDEECEPKTCDDLGAECGSLDDGCGGTLDCGGCNGELTCGGGGTANVCGASCRAGCPEGYSCNNLGVWTGYSSTIVANMPTATVTLEVQLDGRQPTPDEYCEPDEQQLAVVSLESTDGGGSESFDMPCDGSPLEVTVPQGSYRVWMRGERSDMPYFGHEAVWRIAID